MSWGHVRSDKNLGHISSAILTFIGYKQTDKQSRFIEMLIMIA